MSALISAIGISIAGGSAHADGAEAELLFNQATQLQRAGKLAEACEAFEASNRADPRAGTLINLGDCRVQNGQLASAWSAYREAAGRAKDPAKLNVATSSAAALEPKLSLLTLTVSDQSRIDGLVITRNGIAIDPTLWNRTLPVDGGDYLFIGRAPGHRDWQLTVHIESEGDRPNVAVPRLELVVKLRAPVPQEADDDAIAEPPPGMSTRHKLSLGLAGAGVLSVATGAVLGVMSRDGVTNARSICPNARTCAMAAEANNVLRTSNHEAIAADVAFGAATAMAISAGILWFTGGSASDSSIQIVPKISPEESSLVVAGRF